MSIILQDIKIDDSQQFHTINGKPLYDKKFFAVGKFHPPGLAPVEDETGAYHIGTDGVAVYNKRFNKCYGFYDDLAAVKQDSSYFHIDSNGERSYSEEYSWVGNYQENKVVVQLSNRFFHLDKRGHRIYETDYDYVGDFKDDIAVVRLGGRATHIKDDGNLLHGHWYRDLGLYHKGYAIAYDEKGWFHINLQGLPIYNQKYLSIEPFYNDLAVVRTFENSMLRIDVNGNIINVIYEYKQNYFNEIAGELVGFWQIYAYYLIAKFNILTYLPTTSLYLSQNINIPENNVMHLFRAAIDLRLIRFRGNKYYLTNKGDEFQNSFLKNAAIMWGQVASQPWLGLYDILKTPLTAIPTFKIMEQDENLISNYIQALSGYTELEFQKHIIDKLSSDILFVGLSSLGLKKFCIKPEEFTIFFPDNKVDDRDKKLKNYLGRLVKIIDNFDNIPDFFQRIILMKHFLHVGDDDVLLLLKRLVTKFKKIYIYEIVLPADPTNLGLLNLNMILESGVSIRSIQEWQDLFSKVKNITAKIFKINDHLYEFQITKA